ncbi:MAG: hypothetical protein GY931_20365 [Maribacter sp.]|nr:hypothetical protein [Maribacter sp.]
MQHQRSVDLTLHRITAWKPTNDHDPPVAESQFSYRNRQTLSSFRESSKSHLRLAYCNTPSISSDNLPESEPLPNNNFENQAVKDVENNDFDSFSSHSTDQNTYAEIEYFQEDEDEYQIPKQKKIST